MIEEDWTSGADLIQSYEDILHIHNLQVMAATDNFTFNEWVFRDGLYVNGTMTFLGANITIEAVYIARTDLQSQIPGLPYIPDFYLSLRLDDLSVSMFHDPLNVIFDILDEVATILDAASLLCVPGHDEICFDIGVTDIVDAIDNVEEWLHGQIYFNELAIDDFSLFDLLMRDLQGDGVAGHLTYDMVVIDQEYIGSFDITVEVLGDVEGAFEDVVIDNMDHFIEVTIQQFCDEFTETLCVSVDGWNCCIDLLGFCSDMYCEDPTQSFLDDFLNLGADVFCDLFGC